MIAKKCYTKFPWFWAPPRIRAFLIWLVSRQLLQVILGRSSGNHNQLKSDLLCVPGKFPHFDSLPDNHHYRYFGARWTGVCFAAFLLAVA